jgi:hypothetical protein
MSAPFEITQRVRRMAATSLETGGAVFGDVCRRKLQSGLCQDCVRYRPKLLSNTVIYGDTPIHIAVAGSR